MLVPLMETLVVFQELMYVPSVLACQQKVPAPSLVNPVVMVALTGLQVPADGVRVRVGVLFTTCVLVRVAVGPAVEVRVGVRLTDGVAVRVAVGPVVLVRIGVRLGPAVAVLTGVTVGIFP